jgi:hypothetical protein
VVDKEVVAGVTGFRHYNNELSGSPRDILNYEKDRITGGHVRHSKCEGGGTRVGQRIFF